MDINKEFDKWVLENKEATLKDAFVFGFTLHSDFLEQTNLKKEAKIKKLQEDFYNELIPFVATYGKDSVRDFYNWFSQPNQSKTNINRYMQKTWDTKLRLSQWVARNKTNNTIIQKGNNQQEPTQTKKYREI